MIFPILLSFFLIIVGQTSLKLCLLKAIAVSNIEYSERLKRVCNSRFLHRFLYIQLDYSKIIGAPPPPSQHEILPWPPDPLPKKT